MATTIPNFNHQYTVNGLDTYRYTIGNTGTHFASVKISDVTGGYGLSIVISQNGTPIATSTPLSAEDNTKGGELNLQTLINATSGDVIAFVFTSSTSSDTGANQLKGVINLHQGVS